MATIKPIATAQRTDASISELGLTYNQAGYTYNDSRATYGGAYGRQRVFNADTLTQSITPKMI